jgi:hypothetical protein
LCLEPVLKGSVYRPRLLLPTAWVILNQRAPLFLLELAFVLLACSSSPAPIVDLLRLCHRLFALGGDYLHPSLSFFMLFLAYDFPIIFSSNALVILNPSLEFEFIA